MIIQQQKMNKQEALADRKIYYAGALAKFAMYKNKGVFFDAGQPTYNYLNRLGLLSYSEKQMNQLKQLALSELTAAQEAEIGNKKPEPINAIVISCKAKELALKFYFNTLLEDKIELYNRLDEVYETEYGIRD